MARIGLKLCNLNIFVALLFPLIFYNGCTAERQPTEICAAINSTPFFNLCIESEVVRQKGFIPKHLRPPWLNSALFTDNQLAGDKASVDECYACYRGTRAKSGQEAEEEEYCACSYKNQPLNEGFGKIFGNLDQITCLDDFYKIALMPSCGNQHYDDVKHCAMIHFYDNDPNAEPKGYENRRTLALLDGCIIVGTDQNCTANVKVEFEQSATSFTEGNCVAEMKTVFESTIDLITPTTSFTFPVEFKRRICSGLSASADNDNTFNGIKITVSGDCGTKSFHLPSVESEKARVQEMRGLQLDLRDGDAQPAVVQWRADPADGIAHTARRHLLWQPTELDEISANGLVDSNLMYPWTDGAVAEQKQHEAQQQEAKELVIQPGFSLNLLKAVDRTKSVTVSPISAAFALAMAFAGADGQTASEFGEVLEINWDDPSSFHDKVGKLMSDFKSNQTFVMGTVNKVYLEEKLKILDEFEQTMRTFHFGTNLEQFSYRRNDPQSAAKEINAFIEKATDGVIKQMINLNLINDKTRLMLISVMYLNAQWLNQFDEGDTEEDTFKMEDGAEKELPMMWQKNNFIYKEEGNFQLLGMEYVGRKAHLFIVLPKENVSIVTLVDELKEDQLMALIKNSPNIEVEVFFPKFKIESSHDLKDVLPKLGIKNAFDPVFADFSGINTQKPLHIEHILQTAVISVNEKGNGAAAATDYDQVIIAFGSAKESSTPIFRADHPFAFFVVHGKKHVLFSGVFMGDG